MTCTTRGWIFLAGILAALGALVHLACIAGGPQWFLFFRAPAAIVASSHAGTWLAPVGAVIIAALMSLCAAYAFSAAGLMRRLPLLKTGLAAMAATCLLRGLVLVPVTLFRPEYLSAFAIIGSGIWFIAGVGFAAASRHQFRQGGAHRGYPIP